MAETHREPRRVGYARISTYGQPLDNQLKQLRAAGCSSRNIYRENVSGARPERRELLRMLDRLVPGDVVTVTRIDRLARSTLDLFGIVKRIVDAKAQFRSLSEPRADGSSSTRTLDARGTRRPSPTWSAILSAPVPLRAGAEPRPKESTWAGPLPSHRNRRRRPSVGEHRARRLLNWPGATTWERARFRGSSHDSRRFINNY